MRIRRSAARFVGSAYSVPSATSPMLLPLSPHLEPCASPLLGSGGAGNISSSTTVSKELCGLSRSPWDLTDDLPLSDPHVVNDPLESYYVNLKNRTCWLFPAMTPTFVMKKKVAVVVRRDRAQLQAQEVTEVKKEKISKKVAIKTKKENIEEEAKKKENVKKEKGNEEEPQVFMCKKNDGKGWFCQAQVSCPNSLCEHHSKKKHSSNPEFSLAIKEQKTMAIASAKASKSSNSSKTRKKPTNHLSATEGFYYYAGFGPSLSKRHCRSTTHSSAPPASNQEEVEVDQTNVASPMCQAKVETNDGAVAHDDVPSFDNNDDIVGIDEGKSDDDYKNGSSSCKNIKTKKNKNPCKRWRKPVKSRSLKSL